MHRVGFEPTPLARFELESNALDHSAIDAPPMRQLGVYSNTSGPTNRVSSVPPETEVRASRRFSRASRRCSRASRRSSGARLAVLHVRVSPFFRCASRRSSPFFTCASRRSSRFTCASRRSSRVRLAVLHRSSRVRLAGDRPLKSLLLEGQQREGRFGRS